MATMLLEKSVLNIHPRGAKNAEAMGEVIFHDVAINLAT